VRRFIAVCAGAARSFGISIDQPFYAARACRGDVASQHSACQSAAREHALLTALFAAVCCARVPAMDFS
jgi:hypothetical protein